MFEPSGGASEELTGEPPPPSAVAHCRPSAQAVIDSDPYAYPSTRTSTRSDDAPAAPARYSSGRKWSGVGTAWRDKILGEPVEVVDGARPRHRRDGGGVDVPVRRDHENRARPRVA